MIGDRDLPTKAEADKFWYEAEKAQREGLAGDAFVERVGPCLVRIMVRRRIEALLMSIRIVDLIKKRKGL